MSLKDLVVRLVAGGIIVILLVYKAGGMESALFTPLIGFYLLVSMGFVWYYRKNRRKAD